MVPAGRHKVAYEAEMIRQLLPANLGNVPARDIGVDAVHEGGVVAHFRRQRTEQVTNALLVSDVNVEVANHDNAAEPSDALLAPAELPRLHVALEDVDPIFLIEGHPRDLVEAHHV